ncbi:DUF1697 domain-containing protein [Cutibacterium equinum]|uniref:DUF1697 domain-containing protein n=1 Tax=Cutibacterium equinum TaxID=3016342 RepID=A0ABY7QZ99_9ACTN|nr:DUF1697 domain-containing protein [Cutibacterium equinum]WCC80368.1 DUF1697 domain-containing protein [Cutibacterium equinum]
MPRGINVGKSNRVPMVELRTKLEAAGVEAVVTVGRSGNVVVTGRRF